MTEKSAVKLFQIRVLLSVMGVLLLWLLLEYASLLYKSHQIELKKQWFVTENDRLAKTNAFLEQQYAYYKTDYFFKREAKRKLHKKEPGEKVAVITKFAKIGDQHESAPDLRGIPEKWHDFFFR